MLPVEVSMTVGWLSRYPEFEIQSPVSGTTVTHEREYDIILNVYGISSFSFSNGIMMPFRRC